jgi:hypothetical protein
MKRSTAQPDPPASAAAVPDAPSVAAGPDATEARQRWRTVFVDGQVLEATLASDPESVAQPEPSLRVVARLDDELAGVRKNVQDAAAAVLTWVAAVVGHEGKTDLDDILDRCLRPGPDALRVNYAAMAADIEQVTGVELSAKRVQTAIAHLRAPRPRPRKQGHDPAGDTSESRPPKVTDRLVELDQTLRQQFDALSADESPDRAAARREVATDVLTALRSAAGRVIDRDFGEGIPDAVPLPALESRYLDFLRDTLRADAFGTKSPGLEHELRKLLITLADHDATAEADMKLVMHGASVVSLLLGVDSLPGVMARLNVLVAGRALIDTDLYVAEMLRLAARADALHDDADTRSYLNWNRRGPEDRRLPSPIRVGSYCRSNAATRLFDRLFDGELDPEQTALADASQPPRTYLQLALDTHDAMLARDSGFTLTLTTHLLRHVTVAHLTDRTADLDDYLQKLGPEKTLERLEALIRFENNDDLVAAARVHATRVHPALKRRLVCVR